jgi:hypothetical protein
MTGNGTKGGGRKYERSSIGFPYGSLKDAEELANSLHSKWGDDADVDQLAAGLGTTRNSGTFRAKLGTARTFGVLEDTPGRAKLSKLGKQIIDPNTMAAARVEAFRSVPLFDLLYEKHKSGMLPPDEALENEIRELGVSSKQTDRARQSFQRSAEQAGFFAHGRDRLIMPNVGKVSMTPAGHDTQRDPTGEDGKLGVMHRSDVRPEAMDLLATLLTDEAADWPPEKIAELVGAARKVQQLLK